jgi:diguanylate cyclase (GGDEF)-like protein
MSWRLPGFQRFRGLRAAGKRGAGSPDRREGLRRAVHLANLRGLRGLLWIVVAVNLIVAVLGIVTAESARAFLGDPVILTALMFHRALWIAVDLLLLWLAARVLARPGSTAILAWTIRGVLLTNMAFVAALILALYRFYHTPSPFYVTVFAVASLIRLDTRECLLVIVLPSLVLIGAVLWPEPLLPINLSNAINLLAMAGVALVASRHLFAERMRELLQRDVIARQQIELGRQAHTDELTGLPNRRSLDASLNAEWRRAVREGAPLSAIMVDIDHFKQYNDAKGHAAGDDCLRQVAGCLSRCLRRAGDMAARYGGEEFTVLLPGTDLAGAGSLAEAIRREIQILGLPHECTSPGCLTVSLGVASRLDDASDTPQAMLARADKALYAAKAAGRNAVHLFDGFPLAATAEG